jgi:ABC-type Fe3+ transport system permease subunit
VLLNYRVYVLALAYALCFGVELTTHNVIALYLFNHFGLSLTASGLLGTWLAAAVTGVLSGRSRHQQQQQYMLSSKIGRANAQHAPRWRQYALYMLLHTAVCCIA